MRDIPKYLLIGGASVSSILWVLVAAVLGGALVVGALILLALKGIAS